MLTLYRITNKSSNLPCKSPTTVTDLEMAVDALFMFSIRRNLVAPSRNIPATYLACNLY